MIGFPRPSVPVTQFVGVMPGGARWNVVVENRITNCDGLMLVKSSGVELGVSERRELGQRDARPAFISQSS